MLRQLLDWLKTQRRYNLVCRQIDRVVGVSSGRSKSDVLLSLAGLVDLLVSLGFTNKNCTISDLIKRLDIQLKYEFNLAVYGPSYEKDLYMIKTNLIHLVNHRGVSSGEQIEIRALLRFLNKLKGFK